MKREHQSQRRSSSRASSAGAASTATRFGKARARVGEGQADGQSEPRGLGVDANQPLGVVDLGDGRERRALVNAIETPRAVRRQPRQPQGEKSPDRQKPIPREIIVLASPFQTDDALGVESLKRPLGPGAGKARLDEPRPAGERPGQVPAGRRLKLDARRGGDLEPRLGGAGEALRLAVGAGQDQKRGRPPFARGEQEAARGGEAIALEIPDLADDRGRRAAFERLLHRPEGQSGVGGIDEHEAAQGQPVGDQARPIERARLLSGEAFADQQRRGRPPA